MFKKILKNKKAVSLMLSYVILIAIAIAMWGMVYVWIKYSANIGPVVDCKDGTSVVLMNNECSYFRAGDDPPNKDSPDTFILEIKNNGRFNVDGVIVAVGNNPKDTPTTYLIAFSTPSIKLLPGEYVFPTPLKPGETQKIFFLSNYKENGETTETAFDISTIKNVQIQPFIYVKKSMIMCQNAVIKQNVNQCLLS